MSTVRYTARPLTRVSAVKQTPHTCTTEGSAGNTVCPSLQTELNKMSASVLHNQSRNKDFRLAITRHRVGPRSAAWQQPAIRSIIIHWRLIFQVPVLVGHCRCILEHLVSGQLCCCSDSR